MDSPNQTLQTNRSALYSYKFLKKSKNNIVIEIQRKYDEIKTGANGVLKLYLYIYIICILRCQTATQLKVPDK